MAFTILKSHSAELHGRTYSELEPTYKKRILWYQFSVDILPRNSDDADILQIFKRLNATGLKLNNQELRHAEFFGYFSQAVYEIAVENLQYWREWGVFSENDIARMDKAEFVSELFLMAEKGIIGKNKGPLDNIYKKYDIDFPNQTIVMNRIQNVLDKIDETIGRSLKNMSFRRKAIFYTIAASFYDLMYGLNSKLDETPARSLPKGVHIKLREIDQQIEEGQISDQLKEYLSRRTTHPENRKAIVSFIKEKIYG
jgi:thymidylate synthase